MQEAEKIGLLAFQSTSQVTQSDIAGQPAVVLPSPLNILYVLPAAVVEPPEEDELEFDEVAEVAAAAGLDAVDEEAGAEEGVGACEEALVAGDEATGAAADSAEPELPAATISPLIHSVPAATAPH